MAVMSPSELYYDPFDRGIDADPYPVYRRLREEAPLYYNEKHDFYAVSRVGDVERVLSDDETFISGRGAILEFIRADIPMPPGMFIFEDPPIHTRHRRLLARVFTPRRVAELEPKIRAFCARSLDAVVGSGRLDFMADLGAQVPMRTIGMLLGIPEADQDGHRQDTDKSLRTESGEPMDPQDGFGSGESFAEYIDWRAEHPSDDLMTDLLNAEFEDEDGTVRCLTRAEALTYTSLLASAGSETTGHLISWSAKTLADHPDQRRELARDPSLIPAAVEEVLRFEPPGHQFARYVNRDARLHGQTVPEGSVMLFLIGSANRDESRFQDGERFDIHRKYVKSLAFGVGAHYCLGAALARLEGRIALEEILKRFPEWQIDTENARMASASILRGWDSLPAFIP
ncbi:cytochrome P450 [Mycolicibacterium palauense]|uniref:cytochrome P450 n=1 Tax=Mycolicibacterium palauense TaxID=2034511 RepID=UPI000BFEBCB5|nr:cytochrome P450 [Mycolicibacterium palauense]